ncbi:MAG: amino acid ABC transporter ATP-binding protein [Erysipelothrix sp.]|jgi:putative lysine transport system ATP-binding protein|nr:amino acid ABC transporter ATP-binding protein [Erysipelothrix sp.]
MIEIKNLSKSFGQQEVLHDISMNVSEGEVVALIGASGSGKSTLLRCVNLLETPNSGKIIVDDVDITASFNIDEYRAKVGMIFQSFNLFPHLNVLKNCTLAQMKVLKRSAKESEAIALENLNKVGMLDFAQMNVTKLSGGQKQRVAIARALCMNPKILLLDEPTSALDPELVGEVLDVIKTLAQSGLTMLIVTHEMSFAKDVADKVVFMDQGVVVEAAHPSILFNNPTQERTKAFLSRIVHG